MQTSLGNFIRAHRERLKPGDIGLPSNGRRRTPGLRREELAYLCDVSPTWLTWLEQGRPVSASADMLARLAQVLHLSPAERAYLFKMANKLDPAADSVLASSADTILAAVDVIQAPAYILDRQWNAMAWNQPAADLFAGWLDRQGNDAELNLLRYMFLKPDARTFIVDWPDRAQRLVAEFRADSGKMIDDVPLKNMIEELRNASPEFAMLWASHDVIGREGGRRKFSHPTKGELEFEQITLHPATRKDLKLVMLMPGG